MHETAACKCSERWFLKFDFPLQIISDNGPSFNSSHFQTIVRNHTYQSNTVPPKSKRKHRMFHGNVQTSNFGKRLWQSVYSVLLPYRSTCKITNQSPAEIFLQRQLLTILDQLRPNLSRCMHEEATK